MIFQNKKNNQLKEFLFLKKIIHSIVKNLKINIDVSFDDVLNSGFLFNKNTGKYLLVIEEQSMKNTDTNLDYKIVFKIIDFFHEYKHYLQYTQDTIPEIEVSIKLGNACKPFKEAKYPMLPQELEAELYGIIKAKDYITKNFPNIDFEKYLLEYVNNVERWYGIEFVENRKPIFSSYNQVIQYLINNLEKSYDYPVVFYYNEFPTQQDSTYLAYLKSGSEQQYILAKELYRKGKIDINIVEKSKNLFDFYFNKKEENIEDIQLNILKENASYDCSNLQFENDIEKEEFNYENE